MTHSLKQTALAAALALAGLAACLPTLAQGYPPPPPGAVIVAPNPPPPLRVEVVPAPPPGGGHVWVEGFWR